MSAAVRIEATEEATRVSRRARVAVALLFLTNGAVFANLLPRYPQLKAELGLSNAALGTAIAAFPLGALIAGLTAGTLIHRFRSSRVGVLGTVLTAVAILVAGLAGTWWVLAAALFVGGALDAVVDVAQNAHGLRVQRRYGRSILNSFHALWSVGAVLGGLMGSAAAGLDLPLAVHLSVSGVLFSAVALGAYRFMLPGPESAERDLPAETPTDDPTGTEVRTTDLATTDVPTTGLATTGLATTDVPTTDVPASTDVPAPPSRFHLPAGTLLVLIALGVIACCGTVVEDAGASWGALYLGGDLGAEPAVAGLAFVALQGMQFVGRLLGDRLVDRFGQRTVASSGGAIVTLGMGVALAFPSVPLTIIGFGAAGFGVATLVPAAMHAADERPGLAPGTGLNLVSWMLRLGFLLSPPLVGLLADASSLRVGLLVVPVAGIAAIGLSGYLAPVRRVTVPTCLPTSDAR